MGSLIACGLEHYDDAQYQIQLALHHWAINSPEPDWIVKCLPVYAAILSHKGENARAVELLSLAFNHAVYADKWMATWDLFDKLQASLYSDLGDERYEAAWKRGNDT